MKKIFGFLVFQLLFVTTTFAADAYIGASIGDSDISSNNYNKPLGYKGYLGVHVNDRFGVELGLIDLGDFKRNNSTTFSVTGTEISAVGFIPVGSGELFVKLGMFNWDIEYSNNFSTDGTDITFGLGIQLPIKENTAFRFEYQEFRDLTDSNTDFTLLSIGLAFLF